MERGWKDEREILKKKIVMRQYSHLGLCFLCPKILILLSSTIPNFVCFGHGQKQEFHASHYMCTCDTDKTLTRIYTVYLDTCLKSTVDLSPWTEKGGSVH